MPITAATAMFALVIQNSCLVFAMKFAYRETAEQFYPSVVVVCSEAFKLCTCCFVVRLKSKKTRLARRDELKYIDARMALPSLLYVVQNNLLFLALQTLTPTVYMACSQTKIITTAFFSVIILKTKLKKIQYVSILTLTIAMILVQFRKTDVSPQAEVLGLVHHRVTGLLAILLATTISGFSSVYVEVLLKSSDENVTVFDVNIQLGLFSVPFAMLAGAVKDLQRFRVVGIFHGFDAVVFGVILLQAAGGLIVAVVVKFTNSMLKCYAISTSICIVSIVSGYLGLETISSTFISGIFLTLVSIYFYAFGSSLKAEIK